MRQRCFRVITEQGPQIESMVWINVFEGWSTFVLKERRKARAILGEFKSHRQRFRVGGLDAVLENRHEMRGVNVIIAAVEKPIAASDQLGNVLCVRLLSFLTRDRTLQIPDQVVVQGPDQQAKAFLAALALRVLRKNGNGPAQAKLSQDQLESLPRVDPLEIGDFDDPIDTLLGFD